METFEFVAKKNKRRNRVITIILSLVLAFAAMLGAKALSSHFISKKAWEVVRLTELYDAVAYPNQSVYSWGANGGDFFHGGIKNKWQREVAGKPVFSDTQEIDFSWFTMDWSDFVKSNGTYADGILYDIENNQKKGQFYNPNAKSTDGEIIAEPVQEIPFLKEMTKQLVEVYVTFDKPYTLKEIREKIPAALEQNWYWIGTTSTGDPSTWQDTDLFGTDSYGFTREEFVDPEAVAKATKKVSKNGEKMDPEIAKTKTVNAFIPNLKELLELGGRSTYNDVAPIDDVKAYVQQFEHLDLTKKEDLDQLTFGGVVLTGKAEDFAVLEKADWMYASSIGSLVFDFPYSIGSGE